MATEPKRPADTLPTYVGRYRVIERLGKGAMGVVYAALDEQIDRRVAVKVLLGDLEEEPEFRERFLREAKITGQLMHRNVVTLYDMGEDGGRLFLVMELLRGMPLPDYMRSPAAQVLDTKIDLMIQLCRGLQSAHNHGVVHRDVKPTNLFVLEDGTLKILDFGIARLSESNLTVAGFLIGTPEFMSPEQTKGLAVDARSDIFSAAAVFYWMLSGRSPFGAKDLRRTLHAILTEPPVALTDAEAPEPVRRVVGKALSKAPADRYDQCADLIAELERARHVVDSTTRHILQAAVDRYQQTVAAIEERRALGRTIGLPNNDAQADASLARLTTKFPAFAAHPGDAAALEPMDRAAAAEALETLKARHNAELAALEALREQHTPPATAATDRREAPASWLDRAAIWRKSPRK